MKQLRIFTQPLTASLFWGLVGGGMLVVASASLNSGFLSIVPYYIVLFLTFLTFQPQTEKKFKELFLTGILTFVIMSLVLYVSFPLFLIHNPPSFTFFEHLWRLAAVVGMGAVSSLLMTVLTLQKK